MRRYQRYFWIIIPIIMLMTVVHPVSATAVELSVEDCVALALKNNYDIKYVQSSREKYYWAMKEAKKNKGLSIDLTHTDKRYNTPPAETETSTYEYTTNFDNQIALTLPLYSGGKLEGKIEQAKLDLKVAELDIDAAK
ncbi:MAG: tolC 2, partial [Firmicutes bacterium]|nr:tolC 2 [Bacillota bacterium]